MKIRKVIALLISVLPLGMIFAHAHGLTEADYDQHPILFVEKENQRFVRFFSSQREPTLATVTVKGLNTLIKCDDIDYYYPQQEFTAYDCIGFLEDEKTATITVEVETGTKAGTLAFTTEIGRGSRTAVATGADGRQYTLKFSFHHDSFRVRSGPDLKDRARCILVQFESIIGRPSVS